MKILGIHPAFNAYIHDPNIAVMIDGNIVTAYEEERINRFKGSQGLFPEYSLKKVLSYLDLSLEEFDVVAIDGSSRPGLADKTSRYLWQMYSIHKKVEVYPHYLSHAYGAYYGSSFDSCMIATFDGVGDGLSSTVSTGTNGTVKFVNGQKWPGSLGGFYTAFTNYLGFHSAEGEYKLMGMAAYGKPIYDLSKYIRLDMDDLHFVSDTSFWDNTDHTQVNEPNCNYNELLEHLGVPPISHSRPVFQQCHYDLAASVQAHFEHLYIKNILAWRDYTGLENVALSGGCALNCIANMKLRECLANTGSLYIQPAASDRGLAIGTCYQAAISHNQKISNRNQPLYLGISYSDTDITSCLKRSGLVYNNIGDNIVHHVAQLLANGEIVGWFQGASENGPRALGNRSILALPTTPNVRDKLNSQIKYRELFRPFAPATTIENASGFLDNCSELSHMAVAVKIPSHRLVEFGESVHKDGTARIQVVSSDNNKTFHRLLVAVGNLTGMPTVINTSFNVSGEPIVETPQDAIKTFVACGLKYLAIGGYLIAK